MPRPRPPSLMHLYHRTTSDAATAILRDGFRDAIGSYLTGERHRGVWLSDVPLDCNAGATGDALLAVDLPSALVARWAATYEWIEEGKPYREFLVPAATVNRHPRRLVPEEEECDLLERLRSTTTEGEAR